MTRKHFEAIAKLINEQRMEIEAGLDPESFFENDGAWSALRSTAIRLAAKFSDFNSNFDAHRFLTACGF